MSESSETATVIMQWMLENEIVPAVFDIYPAEEGWIVEGIVMGSLDESGRPRRHTFYGTASPDASSFTIESGAFGKLTEDGLDVFADLSGAGVETEEETE